MVGWLEIVSILFRPISLSFRLYGNVYAGETMLEAMAHMVPVALLADPDSVLFHGTAGRLRAGARLHAFDRGLHPLDCATRTGAGRAPLKISAAMTVVPAEAAEPTNQKRKI